MAYSWFTRLSRKPLICLSVRCQATTTSATSSPLSILRKRTGFAYSLCREALTKNDNNVAQSEDWLKAYALTHGLARACKLQSRAAKEGLIGLSVTEDHKLVTLLELKCETDFVAKNELFRDYVSVTTAKYSSK